jgi:hypothetical protein
VLRIHLKHTLNADLDVLSRFYLLYTGTAPSDSGLVTFAGSVAALWNTNIAPLCHSAVVLVEVDVVDLTTPTSSAGAASVSHAGTRTGGQLPAGTAALINMTIARRYRGGKPRVYLPLGTDTDVGTGQHWVSGSVTAFTTGWDNLIAGAIAAPPSGTSFAGQVSVSYYKGFSSVQNPVTLRWRNIPTPRATPVVDGVVLNSCNLAYGSQRRRARSGT